MSATGPERTPLDELVESFSSSVESAWAFLASPETTSNLHDLPANLHQQISALYADIYSKLTQGGTLPTLPEFPSSWTSQPQVVAPPPPAPPSSSSSSDLLSWSTITNHKLLFTLVSTSATLGATYYFFPATFHRRVTPIFKPLIPIQLLPVPARPRKSIASSGEECRKEAVLVLGAQGIIADLALDLERRGFVVIATVQSPAEVDQLEKKSRGWMKVLILDPSEPSSVAPFFRSLNTALSLRFPLHTSGDPFSRPAHTLSLTTIINALPIHPAPDGLRPLEATEPADVRRAVGDRLATMVSALASVIPILRNASARPGAPEGILLSLVPATSSSIALPFLSLSSAFASATTSLLDSLRRELSVSEASNMRLVTLQTGFFASSSLTQSNISPSSSIQSEPIPERLKSIYSGALARRQYVGSSTTTLENVATNDGAAGGRRRTIRKGSPARVLSQKVWEIVAYGTGGSRARVGAGAFTYHLCSFLPSRIVDTFLSLQDRLISLAAAHHRLRHPSTRPSASRPLPSPPTAAPLPTSPIPPVLRPGYAPPEATPLNLNYNKRDGAESDEEEDGDVSSVEDFGYGNASGMGSFVGVEKP